MRKIPLASAVIAVLGLSVVGLTGCSQSAASACPRPVDDASIADLVSVSDDIDAAPALTAYTPINQKATGSYDVVVGDGPAIETDDQLVVIDLTMIDGADGGDLISGSTRPVQLKELTSSFPGLSDALRCATQGSRVVVALAPDGITPETAASIDLAEGDSAIAVVDLRQVYLARADGADVFHSGTGLPAVVRAVDGRPGVVIPDSAPPADLVTQTIKRGDGAEVTGDEPVRVHYTSVGWETKAQVQSTWDAAPPSITFGPDAPAFADALKGQTVGSQVMVVAPGADATVVFVVDILGIDAAESQ